MGEGGVLIRDYEDWACRLAYPCSTGYGKRPHSLYQALKQNLVPPFLIQEAWRIVDSLPMPEPDFPLADPSWRWNNNPWQDVAIRAWEDET